MKQVNVHEAKSTLSRLLEEVETGQEIVIARGGKPIAKLVPMSERSPIIIGLLKGKFTVPDDFDDPLPDDLLNLFEGKNE